MELVYVYLLAWVAGGVLLGATMLLEHKEEQPESTASSEPRPTAPVANLVTLALIGFGLSGLAVEGLGLVKSPWTAPCALVGGALLGALGYLVNQRHA